MAQGSSILKGWQGHDNVALQHTSGPESTKIKNALKFWAFVRNSEQVQALGRERRTSGTWKRFVAHSNKYISLVAMLESMPTLLLRMVLWYLNLDFKSFESFLRRVSDDEIDQVREIHASFVSGHLHASLRWGSLMNRIRRFLRLLPQAEGGVVNGEYCISGRYRKKGKLYMGFLGVTEMGYGYYRNAENDEPLPNKSFLEAGGSEHSGWNAKIAYLKQKAGMADFVLNRDFGIYVKLYILARDWFPRREVRVKGHICPGFWYTWIYWLLMPPVFVCALSSLFATGFGWVALAFLILTVWFPFTQLFKLGHRGVEKLCDWGNDFADEHAVKVDTDYLGILGVTVGVIALAAFVSVILYHVVIGLYIWFGWIMPVGAAFALTVFTMLSLIAYATYMVHHDEWVWPWKFPYLGKPLLLVVLGKLFLDAFPYIFIWAWINLPIFWAWFVANLLMIAVWVVGTVLTITLVALYVYFVGELVKSKDDARTFSDEKYEKYSRIFWALILPTSFIALAFAVWSAREIFLLGLLAALLPMVAALIFGGFVFFLLLFSPKKQRKSYQTYRKVGNIRSTEHGDLALTLGRVDWISDHSDAETIINRLCEFGEKHFKNVFGGYMSFYSYTWYVAKITQDVYERLFDTYEENMDVDWGHADRVYLFKRMLDGVPFDEAEARLERKKRRKKFWVSSPLGTIGRFLVAIGGVFAFLWGLLVKLWDAVMTVWAYRQVFWDLCPMTEEEAELRG